MSYTCGKYDIINFYERYKIDDTSSCNEIEPQI